MTHNASTLKFATALGLAVVILAAMQLNWSSGLHIWLSVEARDAYIKSQWLAGGQLLAGAAVALLWPGARLFASLHAPRDPQAELRYWRR